MTPPGHKKRCRLAQTIRAPTFLFRMLSGPCQRWCNWWSRVHDRGVWCIFKEADYCMHTLTNGPTFWLGACCLARIRQGRCSVLPLCIIYMWFAFVVGSQWPIRHVDEDIIRNLDITILPPSSLTCKHVHGVLRCVRRRGCRCSVEDWNMLSSGMAGEEN